MVDMIIFKNKSKTFLDLWLTTRTLFLIILKSQIPIDLKLWDCHLRRSTDGEMSDRAESAQSDHQYHQQGWAEQEEVHLDGDPKTTERHTQYISAKVGSLMKLIII